MWNWVHPERLHEEAYKCVFRLYFRGFLMGGKWSLLTLKNYEREITEEFWAGSGNQSCVIARFL